MKQGWEIKTIGSICDIKTGKLDANVASENGAYPFFTCSQEPLRIDNYAYDCECVLIAGNGDLNVKYYNGKFNAYQRTYIITIKEDIQGVSVEYLYKFFSKYIEQLRKLSVGGVIKYIKLGNLTDAKLPTPPLSEQAKIVSELDCLSGIIEKKKQQLKELDALAQSIFYEMFGNPVDNERGWEVKALGEVCDVRDGTHDSPQYLEESDYVLITSKNIVNGTIDFTSVNYISEEDYININKRSGVDDGDIIMAMIGTIGKPVIVKDIKRKFCIKNVALIKLLQDSIVTNVYIRALLDDECYCQYIQSLNKGGTQKFVALGTIRKLRTPLPPLPLQQSFAQKIEAIEQQKALIKQSIAEVETLFNSRMDYYFN